MKSKEQKQAEAVERQAAHDELSAMQKLTQISARPGESKREKSRVLASL